MRCIIVQALVHIQRGMGKYSDSSGGIGFGNGKEDDGSARVDGGR